MNEKSKGFTLIEVLVSFSVILLVTTFFPILIKSLFSLTQPGKGIDPQELEVFIHQAKIEVRNAQNVTANGSILTITNKSNQSITYELYKGNIRRRVNGSGHEILLQRVKEVSYKKVSNGAVFYIIGSDTSLYEIRIGAIYKEWNTD